MKGNRKAQINIEFLATAILFLIAVGMVVTTFSGVLPQYEGEADRISTNMEARSVTNAMISQPGEHSSGGGGEDWESSSSTVENMETFGVADEFLQLNKDKIDSLSTVGSSDGGTLNYTMFREVSDVENQYRFRFIRVPIIHMEDSFIRGESPDTGPSITEPDHSLYDRADDLVYYGDEMLEGDRYAFLVTAHDGVYNTTYFVQNPGGDWDFSGSEPKGTDDELANRYLVENFQNRENEQGSSLFLSKNMKTFGASLEEGTRITRFDRYAEMDGEPMRIEVWTW